MINVKHLFNLDIYETVHKSHTLVFFEGRDNRWCVYTTLEYKTVTLASTAAPGDKWLLRMSFLVCRFSGHSCVFFVCAF